MENVDRLEEMLIVRKLTAGRRICVLMLVTQAGGATSAKDFQNLVSSTRAFATREGPI